MKDALARIVVVLATLVAISLFTAFAGENASPTMFDEEIVELRRLAEQGDVEAQKKLGFTYRFGPGDGAEAVKWYRLAAEQGDAEAQTSLADMYHLGSVVPKDYAEAVKWYRLAAEQGHAGAQFVLGGMYEEGRGVPQDHAEAAKWYRLATEQGYIKETWQCFATADHRKTTVLFTLVRRRRGGVETFSEVSVAGVNHLANFSVSGLNRRWDFDYNYAFIIKPDGRGLYYDFSTSDDGRAKPSDFFTCQQRDY